MATCEALSLVVLGHVDHGKSTIVGRLLTDTGMRAGMADSAFLLDALEDERAQGITIEAARAHLRTDRRRYLVMDAPGHLDFLRNMVTGAAHADAALLVLDASEGVRENSRRHAVLASLLGIRSLLVLVNKMDLVDWSAARFHSVAQEMREFLEQSGATPTAFLPVSGRRGENLVAPSRLMPWFSGPTLLQALDSLPSPARGRTGMLRMYVQDVYRSSGRRIVAGTIDSGRLDVGDEVSFHPSGRSARVRTLESESAETGAAIGLTLEPDLYVSRGELMTAGPPPRVASRFQASVFWLGREAFAPGREYTLKIGTSAVPARLEGVLRHVDASTLDEQPGAQAVERNCVADCLLQLRRPVACDEVDVLPETGRFVLVEGHRIAGGGIIRRALADPAPAGRVTAADRAARFGHEPRLVIVTAGPEAAAACEARLFAQGRAAYLLRDEAALPALLDAGLLVVLSAPPEQVERLRALAAPHPVEID